MSKESLMKRIAGLYRPTRKFKGWCEEAKAVEMAEIILERKPVLVVEIGVYDGASLVPLAMAVAEVGEGKVIGIDPWCAAESLKGMVNQENIESWDDVKLVDGKPKGVDYPSVKADCEYFVAANGLRKWCELRQMASHDAVKDFADGSVGMLHIDGNHSAEMVMQDVRDWLPKMTPDGVIVMDDTGWTEGGVFTVRPAVVWVVDQGFETDHDMTKWIVLRRAAK